jgi:hypothetical protein
VSGIQIIRLYITAYFLIYDDILSLVSGFVTNNNGSGLDLLTPYLQFLVITTNYRAIARARSILILALRYIHSHSDSHSSSSSSLLVYLQTGSRYTASGRILWKTLSSIVKYCGVT